MKKILYTLLLGGCLLSTPGCTKEDNPDVDPKCGFYNGRQLYNGPKGGCQGRLAFRRRGYEPTKQARLVRSGLF